ncbi:hypothetical protein [Thalassobaculum sp.]|uniref:hypothetical protein n=1 Tax=Thalassobaculum sp. TaxID=2022740 RepID=UPI0032EFB7D7
MKGVLVAAMLVAAAVGGVAAPVRAGTVGDVVLAVGNWVNEAEASFTRWFDSLWQRIAVSDREARAADAFRQMVVLSPDRIDALAGRAGYALSTYEVSRGDRQDFVLRFRHDRDLDSVERQSLTREVADPTQFDLRPDLALLRILLDAADWRDAASDSRFLLTGVEVQVDDIVTSRLIFSEPKVAR